MKKIITTLFISALFVSPALSFAETTTPASTSTTLSDTQLKAKLLSIKKKQAKTKANLKSNKAQVKATIKKVKKARVAKKAKILKAKASTKTTTN